MRIAILSMMLCVLNPSPALADGYPFDSETQVVRENTIRLRLSEAQIVGVSATGAVTLDEAQLALIHRFYPNAAKQQAVVTATFNDNNEELSIEDVHVFWVAAEEIAVTLNPIVLSDRVLRKAALAGRPLPERSDIRIAPNGQIYIDGKPATLEEGFGVIDKRGKEPGLSHRQVDVCVAPPFRSFPDWRQSPEGIWEPSADLERSVKALFLALVLYGESRQVIVAKTW